jgi:leucokinin receptor
MLVIVVALFAVCWLPLQTYNILASIYPEINQYVRYLLNNIVWEKMTVSSFKEELGGACNLWRGTV